MTEGKRVAVSKNFFLDEFVPPEIYRKFGQQSSRFCHRSLFTIAQGVREHFGKSVTINNWFTAGQFKERGFRMPDTKTGAPLSAHRRGMAIDVSIDGIESAEIQSVLIREWDAVFRTLGVTVIELDTKGWNHLACEYTAMDSLLMVPFYS